MFVVVSAVGLNQVGLVVVRRSVKITIRFDEARAIERLARVIAYDKLHECLIKIAQLRWERMPDVFVGDDNLGRDAITGSDLKTAAINRSDELLRALARRFTANSKNINTQLVLFEKPGDGVQLLRPFVEERYSSIRCRPAVRY